jgi:hypothetical protein
LADVQTRLSAFESIFWIIGGAASGKSTLCRAMGERFDVPVYDMDEHIFGLYMGRYNWERHPASMSWFSAENSLEWAISLTLDAFDSLNRAANVEYLDLFAEDVARHPAETQILVDGGITHPAILAQAIPKERIVCLGLEAEESATAWNSDPERLPMKQMVLDLHSETATWEKFLAQDRQITETIQAESLKTGIKIVSRAPGTSVKTLSSLVLQHFNLG